MGLRYQHLERDGYTESGASGFAREVSDVTLDSLQGILGVRFEGAERGRADSRWRPEIRVAYAHEFGDTDIDGTASLLSAPGSSFDVFTDGPGDDIGLFGIGVTGSRGALDYYVDLEAQAREDLVGGKLNFGIAMKF
ncbi:hypothetical protein ATO8_10378 [Roseivivax marinus]|uniref:Autotransporter domain-containing protein n=1 Tax=Roseivivax marinus TaxID=1379903 RepID=W4HKL4_9RHOB|nr:hypothetical protein ATO8_10378 [Roseivivax marinus]